MKAFFNKKLTFDQMEMNEILISFEIVSKTSTLDKSIFSKEGVIYIYIS